MRDAGTRGRELIVCSDAGAPAGAASCALPTALTVVIGAVLIIIIESCVIFECNAFEQPQWTHIPAFGAVRSMR